jgi:dienelactone hydrolase
MSSGKVVLPTWIKSHQPEHVEPAIESTIKYARETLGVKKIGAVGYCFGGKVCTHSPDPKIQSPKIYLINPGVNNLG